MSLSAFALGVAEKLRPVLVKIVPAKVLSSLKARAVADSGKQLANCKIEPFDKDYYETGVNLIGSIRSDTGLGQSMRLVADIIDNSSVPFSIRNFFVPPGDTMKDHSFDHKLNDELKYNINLIHVNASEFPLAFMNIGGEEWNHRYNIGYWLWELEDFPEEWMSVFHLLDEVWTPSDFITNTIRRYTDKPVNTISYSVKAPFDEKYDRAHFGLPQDKFLFLMMFNSGSGRERKNPDSVISAFKKAFPKGDSNVGLVVKIIGSGENSEDMEYVKNMLAGYENIYFITDMLEKTEANSLIKCVDVYVSLHRAEGYGLVLAESMLLGTPTIATNWSANTEFMNRDVACMVDYDIVELKKDIAPFKKGYRWAEADTDMAAEYMRKLYEDKEFYDTLSRRALEFIREKMDMKKAVERFEKRIDEILR